jgi:hypothetical protein
MTQTVDRIHTPLLAFACHPHANHSDLCLIDYGFWLVVSDENEELIALVPRTQAPNVDTLRSYLRLCDYRGPLTIDDA